MKNWLICKDADAGRLKVGGKGDDRWWDGWMASPAQWTWVWVSSGSWWWTGKPGILQSTGSQRVGHDWATELNWTNGLLVPQPNPGTWQWLDCQGIPKDSVKWDPGWLGKCIMWKSSLCFRGFFFFFCCKRILSRHKNPLNIRQKWIIREKEISYITQLFTLYNSKKY